MQNPQNMLVSSKTGIVLGIPTLGRPVSLAWASAFKSVHPPINYNMTVCQITGAPVAEARNAICEEALKLEARYVFFLGDDVVVPAHVLRQLIMRMENMPELGVVGGVYCSKSNPPAPLVFRGNGHGTYWDWKVGEFFEVTGLGMDATLIRTEVLKKLSKPWFKTVDTDQFADGINKADQWTEDLFFLHKMAEETEYKTFCDAAIICSHEDVFGGKSYTLPPYSLPTRRIPAKENEKRIIDIGCGPIFRDFDGIKPVRVDIRDECTPDYRCDVRELPFADGSFDVVFSSHVLEHFRRSEWESVLKEWVRLINEEGQLILVLPNVLWAARELVKDEGAEPSIDILNVLYGAQSNPYDFHYNGLTPRRVEVAANGLGLVLKKLQEEHYNMILTFERRKFGKKTEEKALKPKITITKEDMNPLKKLKKLAKKR